MSFLQQFKDHRIDRCGEIVSGMNRIVAYYSVDLEEMLTPDMVLRNHDSDIALVALRPCRTGFDVEVKVGPESKHFVSESYNTALSKYEFCVQYVENKLHKMFTCEF